MTAPVLGIGVVRNGVFDGKAEEPIRVVFMLLSPNKPADVHVRALGQLSCLAQNDLLMQQLKKAHSAADIVQLITSWQSSAKN